MIAERFRELKPQVVAGPTTGGIIVSYEVARLLGRAYRAYRQAGRQAGVRGIFAEKVEGGRAFQRGFVIGRGERTLIVDDVLTTGGSLREVVEAVRKAGGQPIGVGVLVDRRERTAEGEFGIPFFACLRLELSTYAADGCPLCAEGVPLHLPAARQG